MSAFDIFVNGLIDYAGLFPPAALDMRGACDGYARHRASSHGRMVNYFIVPTGRLDELADAVGESVGVREDGNWTLSVIAGLEYESDLHVISEFLQAQGGLFAAPAVEMKAASSLFIDKVVEFVAESVMVYFEVPLRTDYRGLITALSGTGHGAKIRTGGLTADLVPSVEEVAEFIWTCKQAGIPFKATAGLHHPIRTLDESVDCKTHGFLNVFGAAAVCHAFDVDRAALERILVSESARDFQFSGDRLRIFDWELNEEQVSRARREFAHSYGSCSIDEPVADLQGLALL